MVHLTNLVEIRLITVVGYSDNERKNRKDDYDARGNGKEPIPAIRLCMEVHVSQTQSEEMKKIASAVNYQFMRTTACDLYLHTDPEDPGEETGTLLNSVVIEVTETTLVLEKVFYDDTQGPIDWQSLGGLGTLDMRTQKQCAWMYKLLYN
jgi:hypothetical protein